MPAASHAFEYDANGNIRRTLASFRALDAQGAAAATGTAQDYWYRYDALNRMVTSKGQLVSGAIVRGSTGVDTYYNAAGERAYALDLVSGQTRREDYVYDGAGRLSQVKSVTGTGGAVPSAAGVKRADFSYDAMGRLTLQRDFDVNGTTILYSRAVTYNNKGQISFDTSSTLRSGVTYRADSTYSYGAIGADAAASTYALGAALVIDTVNFENNVQKKTNKTTNTYFWYDGAQQGQVDFDPDVAVAGVNTSYYYYNLIGGQAQLSHVEIVDGRPRTVYYRTDALGQGIRRDEKDALAGGDPHEVWYRFSGRQMGYVGNNGTIDSDYAASIANRVAAQGTGAFLNGASTSTSFADFDSGFAAARRPGMTSRTIISIRTRRARQAACMLYRAGTRCRGSRPHSGAMRACGTRSPK